MTDVPKTIFFESDRVVVAGRKGDKLLVRIKRNHGPQPREFVAEISRKDFSPAAAERDYDQLKTGDQLRRSSCQFNVMVYA